jgi:hypothetical protein
MIIEIKQPDIPDWVAGTASQLNLNLKQEFHVTITSHRLDEIAPQIALAASQRQFQVTPMSSWWVAKRFYPASEVVKISHTRTTLVQLVEVVGLDELYQQFQFLPPQFPHITLFVGCDQMDEPTGLAGICIKSIDDPQLWIQQIHSSLLINSSAKI